MESFPGPGVGDVCVGPGDDERQDEDGYDDGADACGSESQGSCSLVEMVVVVGVVAVSYTELSLLSRGLVWVAWRSVWTRSRQDAS